jgi:hypothetical protein
MALSTKGIPIVESIRVDVGDLLSIYYWYNSSRKVYQYTRSDNPMMIETDPQCSTRMSYEEFVKYVESKHQKQLDNNM